MLSFFIDKAKYIKAVDFQDLISRKLRLNLSTIDEQLLFYYYRDKADAKYFNYDKFLNKLSLKMKSVEQPQLKMTKGISSMPFSEEEIKKILRVIAVEIDAQNIDFEGKIYDYDDDGLLTEAEFETVMKSLKLNLNTQDVTSLVNKYYNTIDKKVYAGQLVKDLEKYSVPGSRTNLGMKKSHSTIMVKVSKYITKNKAENKVVDEMFMMDKYSEGALKEDEIKTAFTNADIKLSTKQVQDLLAELRADKNNKYNYVHLLISLFGNTSHIKRNQERIKQKSMKSVRSDKREEEKKEISKTDLRKDPRDKRAEEDRFGKKRPGRTVSVSSDGLERRDSREESKKRDRSERSDRSLRRRDSKSDRRTGSRRDSVSSKHSDYFKSSQGSRSPLSRGSPSRSPRRGKTEEMKKLDLERDTSLTIRRDDSRGADVGRARDDSIRNRDRSLNPRDDRGRSDYDSKSRGDPASRSPSDNRGTGTATGTRGGPRPSAEVDPPKKRILKNTEITSISRIVGSQIRNSKEDYREVFRKVSHNDKYKMINDSELFEALKIMRVDLQYGDEKRLSTEIDTQNIRNAKRMFSYEKFLQKAGVSDLQREDSNINQEIEAQLTREEIKIGDDIVEDMQRAMREERLTLFQVTGMRTSDTNISWENFKNGIEDHLMRFWIQLSSNKDRLAIFKLFLCDPKSIFISAERLYKLFKIDIPKPAERDERREPGLFEEEHTFRGDEALAGGPASRGPSRSDNRLDNTRPKSRPDYEEEEDYEETKKYEKDKLRIDDQGKINMAVNDFLIDLKSKEIDFEKTIATKTGFYSDQEFIAMLQKVEYVTSSGEQIDILRGAFRDDKDKTKISVNKMRQYFNTIDPSYLNKGAVKSEADAKQRLNNLPEKVKEYVTRIDNFFKRKNLDIKQIFKEMDKDGNGTISEAEFTRTLMKTYRVDGFDITKFKEVYTALDLNKDNSITVGELMYFFEGAKRSEEERKRQMSKDVLDQISFEISKLFEEFDSGNKGYIVQDDLFKILKAAGVYVDKSVCSAIIRENDTDGDGKLTKKEFEKVMMDKMTKELIDDEDAIQDLNTMFHNADINKDGYLTIDELDIMFKQCNANITYEDLVGLMREIDVDGDGRLDIDEFIALMTMDQSSFKSSKSGNTQLMMKKSSKKPAYEFVKYFKIMPNHFVESFTTRLWKKKKNLPSSVFEPKINSETLLYKDLKEHMLPKSDKDHPILAFQLLIENATGVPYPKEDPKAEGSDMKIVKREVRVSMYDTKTGKYIANSAYVHAIYETKNLDKWKFNSWGSVGPNPLIFTSKDKEVVGDEADVHLIFEFVIVCKMGQNCKDMSCGFSALPLKELRDKAKRKNHFTLDIKGGSPDLVVDLDPFNFNKDLGLFRKIQRGNILSRTRVKLRFFEGMSAEGKFNISLLPSTCIINKKLLHFCSGYRVYLSRKLCKETTDNAGFIMPSGNHVIKTFPFILDNPDVCHKVLMEWHNNVSKHIPKTSKRNMDFIVEKVEVYISRLYLVKYADNFNLTEGKEYESTVYDEQKHKLREELLDYALKADMPKVTYKPQKKIEAMTTFKPFNIRELELDVFDSHANKVGFYQQEFEQKGLVPTPTSGKSKSQFAPREGVREETKEEPDGRSKLNR